MTSHEVVLIAGDGIGSETSAAMQAVVAASGAEILWDRAEAGAACLDTYGTPLPPATLEKVREKGVAIKGPVTTPVGSGFRSVNVALRRALDLYVCLRPVVSLPGAGCRYDTMDIVIVRENTEDLYAGIEAEAGSPEAAALRETIQSLGLGQVASDAAISIKPISHKASQRILRFAFEYALAQGRSKVTAVHKANIMKHTDGLFLTEARQTAQAYEGQVAFDDKIIDAFCMGLVMDPTSFDVVVLPNLYGDIASDLAAGMAGGLGLAPGANLGDSCAIFEAVHGSAPDIAGQNKANPTAEILSAAMMLDHLGERDAANRIRLGVQEVYRRGEHLTGDIRKATDSNASPATTTEFTEALVRAIEHL